MNHVNNYILTANGEERLCIDSPKIVKWQTDELVNVKNPDLLSLIHQMVDIKENLDIM